ncbi:hypothetical protein QFC24_006912 [Naganishia onofrii]|uniref:Uncharacterized protein n=1 Tax=Naganishia onofrii TaxID=1851511 RepID=A0ACC2WX47_9TREE|nr:hypothetical protein QFC24_006912 [Naganishia onofrii]
MVKQLQDITSAIAVPPVLGNKLNSSNTSEDADIPAVEDSKPQDGSTILELASGTTPTASPDLPKGKKAVVKKALQDLWVFLKTPLGFVVGIYGFLVVVWGAALVIILAGWTPMTKRTQDIWVEVCSQVLNGLFTVTGIGLIPWRVQDAWHMSVITRYRRKVIKLTERSQSHSSGEAVHRAFIKDHLAIDISRLSDAERERLANSERRFAKSQPWYNAQETSTHKVAFALPMLYSWSGLLIQFASTISDRHTRPAWTTALLIVLSFGCGIGAAVLIWWGGKKSLKKPEETTGMVAV